MALHNLKLCLSSILIISYPGKHTFSSNFSHLRRWQSARKMASIPSQSPKNQSVRFQTLGTSKSKIPVTITRNNQTWTRATTAAKINPSETDPVQLARAIFFQGVENVIPSRLVSSQVQLKGSLLKLANAEGTTVDLSRYKKKYVVGFGKACLPMAENLLTLLDGMVDRCIVSVPYGFRVAKNSFIEVHNGAESNIPDEASYKASKEIVELVRSCTPKDLLIVLISGGGSALLTYPIPPMTLEEKQALIRTLSKAGCTINELNTVRKRLSLVKGGGLVQMCNAGKMISLIISDVAGSPLDIIASGPTVENLDPPSAALKIIEKYNLEDNLPASIHEILAKPPPSTIRSGFDKVTNFIIGDNQIALEAAASAAEKLGLQPYIITNTLSGEASAVGYDLATVSEAVAYCLNYDWNDESNLKAHLETITSTFQQNNWSTKSIIPDIVQAKEKPIKGVCLLFGGETTVKVRGNGVGGRNQELALASGIRLDMSRNLSHVKNKVAILSAGTDGIDGPNGAAGAIVEGPTIHNAQLQGYSPVEYLRDNNSFCFFNSIANGKYHIICGHTETNVMDISIVVVMKKTTGTPGQSRL